MSLLDQMTPDWRNLGRKHESMMQLRLQGASDGLDVLVALLIVASLWHSKQCVKEI
jgi:hypothetical protein